MGQTCIKRLCYPCISALYMITGRQMNRKRETKEDDDLYLYEHDLLLDMDDDDEEERAVILSN